MNNKMNAFISYSHHDQSMLDTLHSHLAQLKREQLITVWTDNEITAGQNVKNAINTSLSGSKLFLALLSPSYIASNYCYEVEFKSALKMQEKGELIIIPIIIEPCDWHNTPFKDLLALPKDGKPISTWDNINTAFLGVIQGIRKVLSKEGEADKAVSATFTPRMPKSNYRVKKDFDSIEKMEFLNTTFMQVTGLLSRYLDEVKELENIKAHVFSVSENEFNAILVNRNKIATECKLSFSKKGENIAVHYYRDDGFALTYTLTDVNHSSTGRGTFGLAHNDYQLYWTPINMHTNRKEFAAKDIADEIWNEWLQAVGIMQA